MDKGIIMWGIFLGVFICGVLISRIIKKDTEENGIETDGVVSHIVDDGAQDYIDSK